jgi:type I restriction enzyme S subunit
VIGGESELEKATLRYVCELNPGKSEVANLPHTTPVAFVPLDGFGENGEILEADERELREVYDGYTYFREGDIALAKITPSFENGKGAICSGLEHPIAFGTTELHILRPRDDMDRGYLWYSLRSKEFRDEMATAMRGVAGQKRIPSEVLGAYEIRKPEPTTQARIASFLDHHTSRIDRLIERKQRLLELLEEKRQAVITEAVTRGLQENPGLQSASIPWLDHVPGEWNESKLRYLVDSTRPITYGIVQAGPHRPDGIPYIKTSDMSGKVLPTEGYDRTSEEIHNQYDRSHVRPGDLVLAIRATVGKTLPVPEGLPEANLTQGTARIAPGEKMDRRYFFYLLNSPRAQQHFESRSKGATFSEVTLGMVRDFPVPVPPVEEQRAISDALDAQTSRIDNLRQRIRSAIELLQEKRQALITAAVTGQIDVTDWEPPEDDEPDAEAPAPEAVEA